MGVYDAEKVSGGEFALEVETLDLIEGIECVIDG
jgi:hypothetical protein